MAPPDPGCMLSLPRRLYLQGRGERTCPRQGTSEGTKGQHGRRWTCVRFFRSSEVFVFSSGASEENPGVDLRSVTGSEEI